MGFPPGRNPCELTEAPAQNVPSGDLIFTGWI